jgi:hypothetical protein
LMLKRITTFDEFKSGVFKEEYPAFWYWLNRQIVEAYSFVEDNI